MNKKCGFCLALMIMFLTACGSPPANVPTTSAPVEPLPSPGSPTPPGLRLEDIAAGAITALACQDLATLARWVHPELGLRFSPYAYVREDDLVFLPGELPELWAGEQVFNWGFYDGSGEPIALTFKNYFLRFVYSADFAHAEKTAINQRIGEGNSLNNIAAFYPGSVFVEYHFSSFDPQYAGMDWQSLRLVFLQIDGQWWLVGIVHDEWTI